MWLAWRRNKHSAFAWIVLLDESAEQLRHACNQPQ